MSHTVRFQETLRRLTMIDEGFIEGRAGLGLGLAGAPALDAKIAALLRLGAAVAIGSPGVCLEWSTGRALAAGATEEEIADALVAIAPVTRLSPATGALAAGATEEEIADALVAIAPVAGLSRVVAAAPEVAIALGYDVMAALEEPNG